MARELASVPKYLGTHPHPAALGFMQGTYLGVLRGTLSWNHAGAAQVWEGEPERGV